MALTIFNNMAIPSMLMAQWGWAAAYKTPPIIPDWQPPANIAEDQLHPLEKRVLNGVSPSVMIEDGFPFNFYEYYFGNEDRKEYLRFRRDDPKDKFLFLSSQDSYGFDPGMGAEKPKFKLLSDINKKFDLKFKVVKSHNEICEEVKQAAKIGKLVNVFIDANGDSEKICLSEYISCLSDKFCGVPYDKLCSISNQLCGIYDKVCNSNKIKYLNDIDINEKKEFLECFKGLDPSGKIILLSNLAGAPNENGNPKENIAQKIATAAKRAVIAPVEWFIYRTEMPKVEDFEIFDTASSNLFDMMFRRGKNIYKLFHPIYESCLQIFKNNIHAREQLAIETITNETSKKSTLIQPSEFDDLQDLLRFCKDDPKQKFLYLSMEADHNGALHPRFVPHILEPISKEYDLKFKVVKSYEELCNEVKEAAKIGDLLNIIINGHGSPQGTHISGTNTLDNYIHMKRNLAKCFEGVDLAKITMFSCSTNAPVDGNPKNNIAHSIADARKDTVVAPVGDLYATRIKLTSINPFEVYHASQCDQYDCKSNENTFQTIESKTKP